MEARERLALDREVLNLTDYNYNVGSLISDREANDMLARAKRTYPDMSLTAHIKIAAEDIIEYAIGVGNISLDEEFAN